MHLDSPHSIGLFLAALGAVFAVVGVVEGVRARRFLDRAERTVGMCVDLRYRSGSSSDGSSSGTWAPVMRFTTRDGRDITATSSVSSSPAPVRRGREAPVLYDPERPEDFRVDNLRGRGSCLPPFFVAFGLVFVVVGLLVAGVGPDLGRLLGLP